MKARRTNGILLLAVWMSVVWSAAEPAWAQRGRVFRRMFGFPPAQLAALPEVDAELELSDDQRARIAAINEKLIVERRGAWGTGFGKLSETRRTVDRLNQQASREVFDVLAPEQRARLQQISIQLNGPLALLDPEVAEALGLSAEQRARLAAAREEINRAFDQSWEGSGWENWRGRMSQLNEKADQRLLAVLTKEQQEQFEQMAGPTLAVDVMPLYRAR